MAGKQGDIHAWRKRELRRRLAFGVLRGDVYTSVLLNMRPLLSFEEVDLRLPCTEDLWHNVDQFTDEEQSFAHRLEEKHQVSATLSDLVQILLERQEPINGMLAVGYELCLFGLQLNIWKTAHYRAALARLSGVSQIGSTGSYVVHTNSDGGIEGDAASNDRGGTEGCHQTGPVLSSQCRWEDHGAPLHVHEELERGHRQMRDMRSDGDRVHGALARWRLGHLTIHKTPHIAMSRDTLMSSTVLWHLSQLQLRAPLQQMHAISYRVVEGTAANCWTAKRIRDWAASSDSEAATKTAIIICDILQFELAKPPEERAKFNFIAFTALHHAAVVLWSMSEVGDTNKWQFAPQSVFWKSIRTRNTRDLLQTCADMFHGLSPLGGASFGSAAKRLSSCTYPRD